MNLKEKMKNLTLPTLPLATKANANRTLTYIHFHVNLVLGQQHIYVFGRFLI